MEFKVVGDKRRESRRIDRIIGRCEMFDEIAWGGMATIHLGRMLGAGGFRRTVAIKRLHEQFAHDPEFLDMFLDEARIVARIRHPNVIPTLDLVDEEGELYIIMEYVEGISFAQLSKTARERKERVPPGVAVRIVMGALHGLHAAHEATSERGEPLGLVHRDVSPENIMVGVDGYPRVLDFGVARAMGRSSATRDGKVKGKLSYMSPEQIMGEAIDRRSDVFGASAVLWQALTGHRLFRGENPLELAHKILNMPIEPPSTVTPDLPKRWDAIVLRGLERKPEKRWKNALAMAEALESVGGMATNREVGLWVKRLGADRLSELTAKVSALELKPVAEETPAPKRVRHRSQLHVDPDELQKAIREAQAATAEAPEAPVGPPAPDDTGEIHISSDSEQRARPLTREAAGPEPERGAPPPLPAARAGGGPPPPPRRGGGRPAAASGPEAPTKPPPSSRAAEEAMPPVRLVGAGVPDVADVADAQDVEAAPVASPEPEAPEEGAGAAAAAAQADAAPLSVPMPTEPGDSSYSQVTGPSLVGVAHTGIRRLPGRSSMVWAYASAIGLVVGVGILTYLVRVALRSSEAPAATASAELAPAPSASVSATVPTPAPTVTPSSAPSATELPAVDLDAGSGPDAAAAPTTTLPPPGTVPGAATRPPTWQPGTTKPGGTQKPGGTSKTGIYGRD